MKLEWLRECYKTKEEAINDVYEYIWAYYNRSSISRLEEELGVKLFD